MTVFKVSKILPSFCDPLSHFELDSESLTKPSMDSCFCKNDNFCHSVLDTESQKTTEAIKNFLEIAGQDEQ